jgi:hypothetical protein
LLGRKKKKKKKEKEKEKEREKEKARSIKWGKTTSTKDPRAREAFTGQKANQSEIKEITRRSGRFRPFFFFGSPDEIFERKTTTSYLGGFQRKIHWLIEILKKTKDGKSKNEMGGLEEK